MKNRNIEDAIAIAVAAHIGQKDKGGKPYILHCLAVMNRVNQADDELMQIAVLHDVDEDTEYKCDDLFAMGFSNRVVSAVAVLSKRKGEVYTEYLDRIARSPDAIRVKLADLEHNMDLSRLKRVTLADETRVQRYKEAHHFLCAAIAQWRPERNGDKAISL